MPYPKGLTPTALRAIARKITAALWRATGRELGFVVLVFDFGDPKEDDDAKHLAYFSNANRADMTKTLREYLLRVETGTLPTDGGAGDPRDN